MKKQLVKILYDVTILSECDNKGSSRSGIFFVTLNILKVLNSRQDIKLYLYSLKPESTKNFLQNYQEYSNLELYLGDIAELDVFLSPIFEVPDTIKQSGIPCFTIIYDAIPLILPEYAIGMTTWFGKMFRSLSADDYCFSISDYTTKDFLKYCPKLDAKKITTIPLSTNQPYKPNKNLTTDIRQKYNIPENKKYLFSLCSLEPRKNLIRAVKTFILFIEKNKIDDLVFVLGGGAYGNFIERFKKEVPQYSKYKDKIIHAGYVDDKDLEVLYSNAEWFVYTSQYEGFGMPPLEAMACGTAVITSNNTSLPEVVGDAGIMIDWDSDEQHVAAYEKYYFDKKYRDEIAKKGLARSKQFSWKKAVDIMIEQFKKCPQNSKRTSFILKDVYNAQGNIYATKVKYKLFNFIPLMKIKKDVNKIKIKLFGFLPIFSYKQKGGRSVYKILGLPFFKIKRMENGIITKYYILNIPVMKVSRKECR